MPGNPNQKLPKGREDDWPPLATADAEARLVAALNKAAQEQQDERLALIADRDRLQKQVESLQGENKWWRIHFGIAANANAAIIVSLRKQVDAGHEAAEAAVKDDK
ncbi:MAG: hypothetical protein ACE1Y4_03345 [Lysobacterales bacterium]